MDARWASVIVRDDDYFIVLEVSPSLIGSEDFCSLGGTPSIEDRGFGGTTSINGCVGLKPKLGVFHPS